MSSEFKFRALTSEDWKEVIEDENLTDMEGLSLKDLKNDGTYKSEPLDSGIPGCSWHRIVLNADIPENSTITISFNTSETEEIENSIDWSGKIVFKKAKDALIQVPPGRYIRLKIDFHREGEKSPVLKQVKIYYQRLSYLRYLPAIYQENSESKEFLERFLSIFESSMYDSEETISSLPMYFDPMAAPEEFYLWLADWMSLDLYDLLEEKKKREFILRAVEFYKQKGTVSGIASLVSFLTGKKCCIKEYKNNVFRSWGMEHIEDNEIESDEKVDILKCRNKADKNKPECTKFYRRTSRTIDKRAPGLLANRGKYCDEIHYVIGISQKTNTSEQIDYFPNSIGIFVFFPFGDKLLINRDQLRKIIDSFLPVFVIADITFVETPLEESYSLSWIDEKYTDKVEALLEEGKTIKYVKGEYTDKVKDWIRFYTYYRPGYPNPPPDDYGRTYSENNPEYKNFRTVHASIGFKLHI